VDDIKSLLDAARTDTNRLVKLAEERFVPGRVLSSADLREAFALIRDAVERLPEAVERFEQQTTPR